MENSIIIKQNVKGECKMKKVFFMEDLLKKVKCCM